MQLPAASILPEAVIGQGANLMSQTSRVGEKGEMPRTALFRHLRLDLSEGGRPYLLVSFWSLYVVVDSFDIVSGWLSVALFEDGDWRNESR